MLNFSYDVPVKLLSCHLLAMAMFLVAPDLGRLANLFFFNRAVEPAAERRLVAWKWSHGGALVIRTALVIGFTSWVLADSYENYAKYGAARPRPPFYGIWNVEEFTVDGKERPPVIADPLRWRRVIFDFPGVLSLQLMDDTRQRHRMDLNTDQKTMVLSQRADKAGKATLTVSEPGPGLLVLEGTHEGRSIRVKLRRADGKEFLLMSREFHWINELPFNR
jgi:hypothetical protein